MAFTFPVPSSQFASLLRVRSVVWSLEEYYQESGTGAGHILRAEIAAPKWAAEIVLPPMARADAREVWAMARRIGAYGTFNLFNPAQQYPAGDPDGSVITGSNPTVYAVHPTDRRKIRIAGLPAGYDLTWGDMFAVDYATAPVRRALFEVADEVSADGDGLTAYFEVTPAVRAGVAAGDAVMMRRPSARMMFRSFDPGVSETIIASGISFSAIEAPLT